MSNYAVAGSSIVGFALEHTPGIYRHPKIFLPLRSENIRTAANVQDLRYLDGGVDISAVKAGDQSLEGAIEMDIFHTYLPHLLEVCRGNRTFNSNIHTFIPGSLAEPLDRKTFSLTIVKNEEVFAYTGGRFSSLSMTVANSILQGTFNGMFLNEVPQQALAASARDFLALNPFGAGEYHIELPHGTQVFDLDGFTFDVDDSGENNFRLNDVRNAPMFIKYGERSVSLTTQRDFSSRSDYDNYRNINRQSLILRAEHLTNTRARKSPREFVEIGLPDVYVSDWDTPLSGGQSDLIRSSTTYMGLRKALTDIGGPSDVSAYMIKVGVDSTTGDIEDTYWDALHTPSVDWKSSSRLTASPAPGADRTIEIDQAGVTADTVGYAVRWKIKGAPTTMWSVLTDQATGASSNSGVPPALVAKTSGTKEQLLSGLPAGVPLEVQVCAVGPTVGLLDRFGPWSNLLSD